MTYKVGIKLSDDTMKEFTIKSDIDLPIGLGLTMSQITKLFRVISSLTNLMSKEGWKAVEVEIT